jgi:hypothetical protein
MRPAKRRAEMRRITMGIKTTLLVIGVVLTVTGVLLGHRCCFLAVEAFVRLATVVLIFAVAA